MWALSRYKFLAFNLKSMYNYFFLAKNCSDYNIKYMKTYYE